MSDESMSEPTRWLDDPGAAAGLRADLAQVAGARVVGLDHASGLAALRGAIAVEPAAPLAAATKAAGAKTLGLVGGLAIGVVAAGWLALGNPASKAVPSTVPAAAETHVQAPVAAAPIAVPERRSSPTVVAPPRPEPVPDAEPIVITDDMPPVAAAEVELAPTKERRPARDDAARAPTRERDGADAATVDAPSADANRYLEEAKLVARARKQLTSDPAAALALTKQHAREYPEGALVEERRAISIRALAQLGRMDEARAEADAFLASSGDGPYAQAVRRAIAGTDSPD